MLSHQCYSLSVVFGRWLEMGNPDETETQAGGMSPEVADSRERGLRILGRLIARALVNRQFGGDSSPGGDSEDQAPAEDEP